MLILCQIQKYRRFYFFRHRVLWLFLELTSLELKHFWKLYVLYLHFYMQKYDHEQPTFQYLTNKIFWRDFLDVQLLYIKAQRASYNTYKQLYLMTLWRHITIDQRPNEVITCQWHCKHWRIHLYIIIKLSEYYSCSSNW